MAAIVWGLIPAVSAGFQFDHWRSGMSLDQVIDAAEREKITLYRRPAALSPKGIDPLARLFLNRQIDPVFTGELNEVSYGTNLLKKWATVTLRFTPVSKQLSSVTVEWTEFAIDHLKNRRFDPVFLDALIQTLERKYGKTVENAQPRGRFELFQTRSFTWEIGSQDKLSLSTDYRSIQLEYSNTALITLADQEASKIKAEKAAEAKAKEAADRLKF